MIWHKVKRGYYTADSHTGIAHVRRVDNEWIATGRLRDDPCLLWSLYRGQSFREAKAKAKHWGQLAMRSKQYREYVECMNRSEWTEVRRGHFITSNPAVEFHVRQIFDQWETVGHFADDPARIWRFYKGPSLEEAMNAAKLEQEI